MIQVGNIINNKVLFTADELKQHLRDRGNPPHVIFGQAILACRLYNLERGEFVVTLQIQGIGLDDVAGAQVRVEYTSSSGQAMNVVVRMGWQHLVKGANLNMPIYLTVLSIPSEALSRETIVDKLRTKVANFRARKVKKGGNQDLEVAKIYLQKTQTGLRFQVQAKQRHLQSDLVGLTLRVTCYGHNGQSATVDVQLDGDGYSDNITGVSQDHPLSVAFL
jgi:hypothetical protein